MKLLFNLRQFPLIRLIFLVVLMLGSTASSGGTITLSLQNINIHEVMQLLAREQRLNIFVADGVDAEISVNIYDMETTDAIRLIAESAGFVVEFRENSYFIIDREDVGRFQQSSAMEVRAFKVQYTTLAEIESVLTDFLSSYGSIKTLPDNGLIVVEDLPPFLDKIERILAEIDREPRQIMIEAKILEISLTDNQSYGLNWSYLFSHHGGTGTIGTQGLANKLVPGLFGQYSNSNVELVLSALKERGRLRTISTPKLLAMEGFEAESIVGANIGYRVTTTVNLVTSESIEFLETGIILRVTPTIDRSGRIMLEIHPEVSTGVVSDDGIPSKSTTQVTTRMLVPSGKTVFLGGLIKHSINSTREGVPGLGDLPFIGNLFSNDANSITSTEIVVLITPTIVEFVAETPELDSVERVEAFTRIIEAELDASIKKMDEVMDRNLVHTRPVKPDK